MASAWFPSGKAGVMNGGIDLDTSDIRVMPLQSGYTYSAAHDNLDDIIAGNRAGSAVALGSKTIITPGSPANARALDAADTALGVLANAGNAVALYLHTGTESTSTLLAYIDGFSWTAGQNVTVQWDVNGIIFLN